MTVKYYLKNVDGLVIPRRANASDAGYDIVATSDPKLVGDKYTDVEAYKNINYIEYETNLYFTPQSRFFADHVDDFYTDLRPRSSISKYNLMLANSIGLIDRGYKHQVLCRFKYIWQPQDMWWGGIVSSDTERQAVNSKTILAKPDLDKIYKKGDKIAQMLAVQTVDIEFEVVNYLPGEDRGGGFGSTGK